MTFVVAKTPDEVLALLSEKGIEAECYPRSICINNLTRFGTEILFKNIENENFYRLLTTDDEILQDD